MAAPANRFARVAAPDPDAVTVTIRQGSDGVMLGEVEGPASSAPGGLPPLSFGRDGSLGAHQALAVGCQLANELGREVVVIDEGGNWRPAWGRLEPA
ncbi:hypothetical protein [Enterovirga aerilata]|uniref:Uncharacterized protein n=1 Tax=Enterovirga aerilata TaxID=2730920 RepID=A0A849I7Z6_9HYPH|nr:hypothetical protein [Enterovirga sp. DB1703]NNM73508.1 hypothetical protein [Enterovirga sp. DB1703]